MDTEENRAGPLTEEQEKWRELGRKGGIASGVARRKRKALREYLEILLAMRPEKTVAADLAAAGLAPNDVCNAAAMMAGVLAKAIKGDVAAFKEIRSLVGEDGDHHAEILLERAREILDGVMDGT